MSRGFSLGSVAAESCPKAASPTEPARAAGRRSAATRRSERHHSPSRVLADGVELDRTGGELNVVEAGHVVVTGS